MSEKRKNRSVDTDISGSFLKHQIYLKKFISRYFSNKEDVEDVVQETYLRAYVAEQKIEISKHKSFLFSTAKNIALTKLTKKSKQITDFLEEYSKRDDLQDDPSPAELVDAKQQLAIYCAAVETLSGKCREAFLLRKVHGMTHKEIAVQMSLSLSSVEKYLHRAMLFWWGLGPQSK
jgi:RNA polymerase sigma-70 factor (ECF subfamily)